MVINGKVTMIKATGEGLVAEIALERDGYTYYQQAIQVNCPREPRELDVGDDIAVTIRKRVEERDGVPSEMREILKKEYYVQNGANPVAIVPVKVAITDTDRLSFLLKHFWIDDIGDDRYVPGVVIDSESLEDVLTWGKESPKRINQCDTGDFRVIIDKAIRNSQKP